MANIAFKRGLSTNLPTSASDGVFYLTTDSHRLYVGQGTSLVELNRYILEVADTSKLPTAPHEGDFVWVKSGNMLLVCTDPTNTTSLQRWTQINPPDTDNDTSVTSITTPDVSSTADGITVSFNIKQSTKNNKTGTTTTLADIPVTFTIAAEDLVTANEVAVGLGVAANNGGAKIVTAGAGADADEYVRLMPGSNVTMSVSGDDVIINAKDTTYTLTAASDKITLTNSASTAQNLALADDDIVTLTASGNTITAAHATFNPSKTTSTATDKAPVHGGTFKVIDGISTNASGHITGYTEKTVTLPSVTNTTNSSATIAADNTGKLSMSITDSAGKVVSANAAEAIYYMVNGEKVANQGSIEFYTKEEVDGKFHDVNAMVFKGTVGNTSNGADVAALPTDEVQRGWTYKVHTAGSYGGHSCDVGDLLIATGIEDSTGEIVSDLAWSYIPSGDDTDSKFTLSVASNKISLKNSTLNTAAGDVTIAAGSDIGVSTSNSTITIKHADFTTTEGDKTSGGTLAHGGSFDVLEAIVTENGHVTGYNKKTYTLPTDNNTTYTIKATDNVITLDGTTGADTTVTLVAGNNIGISTGASDNKITIKHSDFTTTKASTNTTAAPSHGGTFDVLDSITTDNGHITGYTVKTVTLPSDNNAKYTMSGITTESITNGVSATINLTGSGGGSNSSAAMNVTSTSLKVAAGTNAMTIDLEWGSF